MVQKAIRGGLLLALAAAVWTGAAAVADDRMLPAVTFTRADGTVATLAVEVADDAHEMSCGLMFRTELPEDQGMLFAFAQDGQAGGFYMRNTLIPLAIAFIAGDGRIVDILEMEPVPEPGTWYRTSAGDVVFVRDGEPVPPGASFVTYTPRGLYQYAIEANAGWYARHGVQIGDTVNLSAALAAADAAAPPPICLTRGR